mmetsp:Transcript_2159/g.5022  ORF Transcript_2159/g.5022 Transcript_2159/m.5022 type:complete len:212 (+) Transcript_2159:1-636(+)
MQLNLEEILLGLEFGFLRLKKIFPQPNLGNFFSFSKFFSNNKIIEKTNKNGKSFFLIRKWRENLYVIFQNLKKKKNEKRKNFLFSKNYSHKNKRFLTKRKVEKYDLNFFLNKFTTSKFIDFLIFRDLWQRGFVITSGIKFGSTFTAYAGNLNFFHSCTSVFSLKYFPSSFSIDLISFGRVGTSTKKRTIFAFLSKKLFVNYFGIKWLKDLP